MRTPNILVAGRSGVGKSSLINAVFGAQLAQTGAGQPITKTYTRYASPEVTVYDSQGWVHGAAAEQEFADGTRDFLHRFRTFAPDQHLHLIWYALDAPGARFTDFDAHLIATLFGHYPVIIVLTKCDIARPAEIAGLEVAIAAAQIPNVAHVVRVAAAPIIAQPFGLDELVGLSRDLLPELERQALELVQGILRAVAANLQHQSQAARHLINQKARQSALAAMIPVPFVDIPIVLSINHQLLRHIGQTYDLQPAALEHLIDDHRLREWMRGAVIGRSVGIEMIKFIPGVGLLAGLTLNAATSAFVTAAIGYTFREVCTELRRQQLTQGDAIRDNAWIQQYLDATFTRVWQALRERPVAGPPSASDG